MKAISDDDVQRSPDAPHTRWQLEAGAARDRACHDRLFACLPRHAAESPRPELDNRFDGLAHRDRVRGCFALEMISIPTYVLLYLPNRGNAGQEAAVKYFLLSILSSAVLLFGLSYLYGISGSTNIAALVDTLTNMNRSSASPMAVLAMVL